MRKAFYAFLVFILFFLFSQKEIFADSNFSTDYNVTYTVSNSANTHVVINASLTNLTDKYYASSYSIDVGFTDIKNLTSSDSEGAIAPKVTTSSKGTSISLNFNRRVVGLNNKLNFTVSFDTDEVAQNFNHTWDINIPGISKQGDFSSFNVSVFYPSFLGNPTYIKPTPSRKIFSGNKLSFTKEDLGSSGISVAFGNFQVYDLNLTYNLENRNLFPISTEIALPPTTNYQDISIENINPKPVSVRIDKDGNWLANYTLSPSKTLKIVVLGKAKVFLNPRQETLDKNLMQDYLKQQSYWESNNQKIISIAKDLKTPYAIYKYAVKSLNYDFSRIQTNSPRLGAVQALDNPGSAVCLEFTDLFIALSRAAGIPAREIDGYGYTSNTKERPLSLVEDVLHAWPEYYDFDKKAWIMVDPTWGNTTGGVDYFNTLDFDHIAFVIKGESSTYPVPAGGYKLSSSGKTKDVDVKVGSSFEDNTNKLQVSLQIPDSIIAGFPIQGAIKAENQGKTLSQKQEINVSTNFLKPYEQTVFNQSIPPFGYVIIPISFDRTPFLTNKEDAVKITVGNYTTYKNVKILPFFVNKKFLFGGIIFVSICIALSLIAYISRSIFFLRQRK